MAALGAFSGGLVDLERDRECDADFDDSERALGLPLGELEDGGARVRKGALSALCRPCRFRSSRGASM